MTYLADKRAALNKPKIIIAALITSSVGALFYNLLPLVMGVAADDRHLDHSQIGLLGSAFFLGYLIATSSGYYWIRRSNWRLLIGLATPIAIAALLFAASTDNYPLLAFNIFIAGAALSVLYGIGATLVGDLPNASRWYGVKIASEALLGAIIMLAFPGTLIAGWGFSGLMAGLAATVLILMIFAISIPPSGCIENEVHTKGQLPQGRQLQLIFSLVVLLLFFTGETAAWAFIERLGNESGFDPIKVGNILSLTLAAAVLGSIVIAMIGERRGFFNPFFASGIFFLLGISSLYFYSDNLLVYGVGSCLIMFSVGLGIPVTLATTAKLDSNGRYVILTVPVIGLAAMIAPGAAGIISNMAGMKVLLIVCSILVTSSFILQYFICLSAPNNALSPMTKPQSLSGK